MKKIVLIILTVCSVNYGFSQSGFDSKAKKSLETPILSKTFKEIDGSKKSSAVLNTFRITSKAELQEAVDIRVVRDEETGGVIFIENRSKAASNAKFRKTAKAQSFDFLDKVKNQLKVEKPNDEFRSLSSHTDEHGLRHSKFQQTYKGLKLYGAEVIVHATADKVNSLNGHTFKTPSGLSTRPILSEISAINLAKAELSKNGVILQEDLSTNLLNPIENKAELLIYHHMNKPVLAYELVIRPNVLERHVLFMDANTGDVLDKYNHTCTLDGVFETQAKDLNGITRAFKIVESQNTYFMIDATKDMFNANQSSLPNTPVGAIWTIDANNDQVDSRMESLSHITSSDGLTWSPTGVSAHNNASLAFDYYRSTFSRNSLDGKGGNIVSVINITDEDGAGFDNAFWNGEFMGYGNGGQAFKPLAGGLDVAGHEMTHGVIENTANLEYRNQSGALNESFADIFGALIDRDDWTLGEDVVKPGVYPSGAMRSLENPNQRGQNQNGYQPMHMSQYAYLQDTPSQDNGGVHINSGIPNHAFYRFATASGMSKEKAERVYYHTLTNYMTRTSDFVDLRLAVIQSAKDIFGDGAEAAAAAAAFDAVGIEAPSSGQQTPDTGEGELIEVNPGEGQMVVYEPEGGSIYTGVFGTDNYRIVSDGLGCLNKPSITDDGTSMFFVGADANIYYVDLATSSSTPLALSEDGVWQNVAVSKDGKLLAALTSSQDGKIYVFNIVDNTQSSFELYNPTYTQGVKAGDPLYADALEWDYTGEYLIYDAFNRVEGVFGDLEFWDVGILRAWNTSANDFGDGTIQKLFSNLEEGDNVGNPALSKTNPNIIAFDYLDIQTDQFNQTQEQFYILGLNINTGNLNLMIENNNIGYPSYTIDDKILAYTANEAVGEVVKLIPLNDDKISTSATAGTRAFTAGQDKWAVFYAQGVRELPKNEEDIQTKAEQTIAFGDLTDQVSGASILLNAVASSGLPVVYQVVSGDATINGATVRLGNTPGLVTIRATQNGNSDFQSASAESTFCINPATPQLFTNGVLLEATYSAMYQWYINGNPLGGQTVNQQINADRNGIYTVKSATADGCLSGFSNEISIQRVLGISANEAANLSVYPNPAQDILRLKMLNGQQFKSADVLDANGALRISTLKEEFSVAKLPAGLYLVKIKTNKGEVISKFIKE